MSDTRSSVESLFVVGSMKAHNKHAFALIVGVSCVVLLPPLAAAQASNLMLPAELDGKIIPGVKVESSVTVTNTGKNPVQLDSIFVQAYYFTPSGANGARGVAPPIRKDDHTNRLSVTACVGRKLPAVLRPGEKLRCAFSVPDNKYKGPFYISATPFPKGVTSVAKAKSWYLWFQRRDGCRQDCS